MAERPRSPHRRAERKERPYETESGEGEPEEADTMPEMERGEGFESLRQDISRERVSERSSEPIEPGEREPQRAPGTMERRGVHDTESSRQQEQEGSPDPMQPQRRDPLRSSEPMEPRRPEQSPSGETVEQEELREQSAKERPRERRRASEQSEEEGSERRGRQQEREEEE